MINEILDVEGMFKSTSRHPVVGRLVMSIRCFLLCLSLGYFQAHLRSTCNTFQYFYRKKTKLLVLIAVVWLKSLFMVINIYYKHSKRDENNSSLA